MSGARRSGAFAAACLGMLLFGVVLTTLGSVLPAAMPRLGLDGADAGSLFSFMSLSILVGSLVFGPIVDRRGYRGMLALSAAFILLGLEGIAFAPGYAALAAAMVLIGFGGGVINGGTNALAADLSAEGRSAGLSFLGVFFGIGAFGVPFALALVDGRFSYTSVLAVLGAGVAAVLGYFLLVRFPPPKQPQGVPIRSAAGMLRDPVLLLLGTMLFFESGMEITVGGWTATYFNRELGLPADRALYLFSLYWLGMTAARLALGWILRRAAPGRVLLASLGLAALGALTLIGARGPATGGSGAFLVGAGFAAVFPVVLGWVGDRYETLSGTAFSLVLVMGLVGGSTLPLVTGVLGEAFGLRPSLLVVPGGLLCIALTYTGIRRRLVAPAAGA